MKRPRPWVLPPPPSKPPSKTITEVTGSRGEDTSLPIEQPQELSDIAILSQYANKRGFGEEFTQLVSGYRGPSGNPLELLVKAEQAYRPDHPKEIEQKWYQRASTFVLLIPYHLWGVVKGNIETLVHAGYVTFVREEKPLLEENASKEEPMIKTRIELPMTETLLEREKVYAKREEDAPKKRYVNTRGRGPADF